MRLIDADRIEFPEIATPGRGSGKTLCEMVIRTGIAIAKQIILSAPTVDARPCDFCIHDGYCEESRIYCPAIQKEETK